MIRILIFTPYAGHNGAEKMLLYFAQHMDFSRFRIAVYSFVNGPLLKQLPDNIQCYVAPRKDRVPVNPVTELVVKIKNKAFYYYSGQYPPVNPRKKYEQLLEAHITQVSEAFKPDFWYINTVHMSEVAVLAARLKMPYAVHFHDLLYMYSQIRYDHFKGMVEGAALLVGCAESVSERLRIMGARNVVTQYEFVALRAAHAARKEEKAVELKKRLGIGEEAFVWVVSGTVEYRKGYDLIPRIIRQLGPEVYIVCVGDLYSGYGYYLEKELEHAGIGNVIFTGFQQEAYYDYLSMGDGFLLTSREDPFPLVMIEAASFGLPIVSFNSGGVKEFVQEGMGIVIDSANPEDLAEAMQLVMHRQVPLDRDRSVARAWEFDAEVQVTHWQEVVLSFFREHKAPGERVSRATREG